jgi:hypothetical protein
MSMPDPYNEQPRKTGFEEIQDRDSGSAWPWLAGTAVIVAIVLALTFGTTRNDQTATTPPATTTGEAPAPRTAPAENTGRAPDAPRPATPSTPQPSAPQ